MEPAGPAGQHRRLGCPTGRRLVRRRDVATAPDRLQRDLTASRPNQRRVVSLAELPTAEGLLHVAAVRELCDPGILGWAMDDDAGAASVVDGLRMALIGTVCDTNGLVRHSDKGSRWTSLAFATAAISPDYACQPTAPSTRKTAPRLRRCGAPIAWI
jgi:putative transposase